MNIREMIFGKPANIEEVVNQRVEEKVGELIKEHFDLFDMLPFVNPYEDQIDPSTGEPWLLAGGAAGQPATDRAGFADETQLQQAREACRVLAERNEYAINGHENRINYSISTGHTYTAVLKKGSAANKQLAKDTQKLIDDWCFYENWPKRQKEMLRRYDRDGEVFIRFFVKKTEEGESYICIRFVEPWQVKNPENPEGAKGDIKFGIETNPEDVEDVWAYWIDGERVDAKEIQHRKANVDCNVRRGVMLFWPVLKLLQEGQRVRLYAAALAKVRASHAVIRTITGSGDGVSTFTNNKALAALARTNQATGETRKKEPTRPGQIKTVTENVKYEMPPSNIGANDYEIIERMHLRAAASRLVMPEFMLTSDASNANFASTMVAEGPAVKAFETLQGDIKTDDLQILWRVIRAAIEAKNLAPEVETEVEIQVGLPSVAVRDKLKESQVRQLDMGMGILSPQTASDEAGYEYEQEQSNIEQHQQRTGTTAAPLDPLLLPTGAE